jgi:hypothetical protein
MLAVISRVIYVVHVQMRRMQHDGLTLDRCQVEYSMGGLVGGPWGLLQSSDMFYRFMVVCGPGYRENGERCSMSFYARSVRTTL